MRFRILLFIFSLIWFSSCKSSGPAQESEKSPVQQVSGFIEMERSPCMQECASYRVKVFENGSAEYFGLENTRFRGAFVGTVEPAFNHVLWRRVKEADLKKKKGKYGTGNEDTQEVTIRYSGNDFKKEIVFQSFEPIEIDEIERQLKIIAENTVWEKATN
jgi:Domain of unknown function (DUF6438)